MEPSNPSDPKRVDPKAVRILTERIFTFLEAPDPESNSAPDPSITTYALADGLWAMLRTLNMDAPKQRAFIIEHFNKLEAARAESLNRLLEAVQGLLPKQEPQEPSASSDPNPFSYFNNELPNCLRGLKAHGAQEGDQLGAVGLGEGLEFGRKGLKGLAREGTEELATGTHEGRDLEGNFGNLNGLDLFGGHGLCSK